MPRDPDSPGLFAPNQNLPLQHEITDVLEPDTAFVQLASMLGGDAIDHLRSVECAHHLAWPFLPFEQPAKQDGIDLV